MRLGGPGRDIFSSDAAFKIILIDGTEIPITGLSDPATVVGRSGPFTEATEPAGGASIFGGGAVPYVNTAALAPDPIRFPAGSPEAEPARREVHTEILSLNLTGGGAAVNAGQPAYDALNGLGIPQFYSNSFGEVASQDSSGTTTNDFPAESFFNIFAVVETPAGGTFVNRHPLVVRRKDPLTSFPPSFGLPTETYIHDPTFPAVTLYDTTSGLPIGHLQSAGHGQTTVPEENDAGVFLKLPVSFSVDSGSVGLGAALSPNNNVRDDAALPEQQVTVYGTTNPFSNQRVSALTGVEGTPPPPGFADGDAINSMSFGRDGTALTPGVLSFSVDRNSQGSVGSDVNIDGTATVPRQAASIYVAGVDPFCSHVSDPFPYLAPPDNNFQAIDPAILGLRPSLFDTDQDNVTGLELDAFQSASDIYYGTFTGPSFDAASGEQATIYVFEPISPPFQPENLDVFSLPPQVGLSNGDIIDALAVSDVAFLGAPDPGEDEILFSLAPGSPTLGTLGLSAANIFYSSLDGTFTLFADHDQLGLLFSDNVDALDINPSPEPATALLLAAGVILLATGRRRRSPP